MVGWKLPSYEPWKRLRFRTRVLFISVIAAVAIVLIYWGHGMEWTAKHYPIQGVQLNIFSVIAVAVLLPASVIVALNYLFWR